MARMIRSRSRSLSSDPAAHFPDRVSELEHLLAQKEKDATLAAELGAMLLRELESVKAQLRNVTIAEAAGDVNLLLREKLQAAQKEIEQLCLLRKDDMQAAKTLRKHADECGERVWEAELCSQDLASQNKSLQQKVVRLGHETTRMQTQIDLMVAQIESFEERELHHKQTIAQLHEEIKVLKCAQSEQTTLIQHENQVLQKQLHLHQKQLKKQSKYAVSSDPEEEKAAAVRANEADSKMSIEIKQQNHFLQTRLKENDLEIWDLKRMLSDSQEEIEALKSGSSSELALSFSSTDMPLESFGEREIDVELATWNNNPLYELDGDAPPLPALKQLLYESTQSQANVEEEAQIHANEDKRQIHANEEEAQTQMSEQSIRIHIIEAKAQASAEKDECDNLDVYQSSIERSFVEMDRWLNSSDSSFIQNRSTESALFDANSSMLKQDDMANSDSDVEAMPDTTSIIKASENVQQAPSTLLANSKRLPNDTCECHSESDERKPISRPEVPQGLNQCTSAIASPHFHPHAFVMRGSWLLKCSSESAQLEEAMSGKWCERYVVFNPYLKLLSMWKADEISKPQRNRQNIDAPHFRKPYSKARLTMLTVGSFNTLVQLGPSPKAFGEKQLVANAPHVAFEWGHDDTRIIELFGEGSRKGRIVRIVAGCLEEHHVWVKVRNAHLSQKTN